ncbi:fimbrial isopeptide formation D2 domain-containing protein [Bacillus sp. 491mf]|nr:isopeptide-forming domain-containing fimbrial protein [Bacillus sp. 491mf]SFD42833.1 fimbrial isopeptide formation D2 domain-containing protein [Bacillus sp. 491mf]
MKKKKLLSLVVAFLISLTAFMQPMVTLGAGNDTVNGSKINQEYVIKNPDGTPKVEFQRDEQVTYNMNVEIKGAPNAGVALDYKVRLELADVNAHLIEIPKHQGYITDVKGFVKNGKRVAIISLSKVPNDTKLTIPVKFNFFNRAPIGYTVNLSATLQSDTEENLAFANDISFKVSSEPVPPKVTKDVEGKDHLEIAKGKEFNYNLKTVVPENLEGYKSLTLSDTLDSNLTIVGTKVIVDGKESELKANVNKQLVTLKLTREQLEVIKGKEIKVVVTSKINENAPIEIISSKATIQLNDNASADSNVVTVIPTKEEPTKEEPTKEEPTKEEPKKEEPTKEEPAKEEPTKEESTKEEPTKEESTKEESSKQEPKQPQKEIPKMNQTNNLTVTLIGTLLVCGALVSFFIVRRRKNT